MKKIVFICITVFLSITAFTQNEKEITPQVLNDFKAKYPEATKAKWSKEKDITKVEFINDDTKMKVEYLNNTWKKTYWGFKVESTPQKIKDYIKQYYVQYKISNVNFTDNSLGERIYEVEILKKKKDKLLLIFDLSSNFIRIDGQ